MQDTNKTIFHSAKRFLSGTLISRFTGLFRDVAMAFAFGTHGSIAALMVAFRFAHLFRRLLGEGALQMAFVPQFETLRKEDPNRALKFFRDLSVALSLALLIIITIAIGLLSATYLYSDFSQGTKEIILLTAILMPSL